MNAYFIINRRIRIVGILQNASICQNLSSDWDEIERYQMLVFFFLKKNDDYNIVYDIFHQFYKRVRSIK